MASQTQKTEIGTKRKVLVVDDNHDAADTLAMMLRLKGNDIQVRYDGREGVAAAESFAPDIVVLDIGMPGLDGYETCQMIRGNNWGKTMTVFALSGYGQPEDIRKSTDAGFNAHLLKPVDLNQLLNLMDDL